MVVSYRTSSHNFELFSEMNSDQPTESTSLLVSSAHSRTSISLPSITEGLNVLQSRGIHDLHFAEQSLSNLAAQTAYQLLILSQWRRVTTKQNASNTKDIWECWVQKARLSSDLKVLEDRIISVWRDFVKEHRTSKEIQDVLWLQFPVERTGHCFLRGMSNPTASHSASQD
jgi:hypothetical protein